MSQVVVKDERTQRTDTTPYRELVWNCLFEHNGGLYRKVNHEYAERLGPKDSLNEQPSCIWMTREIPCIPRHDLKLVMSLQNA